MKFTIINLFSFGIIICLLLVLALATASLLGLLNNNTSLRLVIISILGHSGVDNLTSVGGHLSDQSLASQLR